MKRLSVKGQVASLVSVVLVASGLVAAAAVADADECDVDPAIVDEVLPDDLPPLPTTTIPPTPTIPSVTIPPTPTIPPVTTTSIQPIKIIHEGHEIEVGSLPDVDPVIIRMGLAMLTANDMFLADDTLADDDPGTTEASTSDAGAHLLGTTVECPLSTPTTPDAPNDVWADVISAAGTTTVEWTPPADNGSPAITGYLVQAQPGGPVVAVPATSNQVVVAGLATNGPEYEFEVVALNANGTSGPSEPSGPVSANLTTPAVPDEQATLRHWNNDQSPPTLGFVLSTETDDSDGGRLRVDYEVVGPAGMVVTSGSDDDVAAGTTAAWEASSALLLPGQTYTWRARAFDGVHYSAWSGVTAGSTFVVDNLTPPEVEAKPVPLVPVVDVLDPAAPLPDDLRVIVDDPLALATMSAAPAPGDGGGSGENGAPTTIMIHGINRAKDANKAASNCSTDFKEMTDSLKLPDVRWPAYYWADRNCGTGSDAIYSHGSHGSHHATSAGHVGAGHTNNADIRHLGYHTAWYIYDRYSSRGIPVNVIAHSMGGLLLRWALYGTWMRARGVSGWGDFPPFLIVRNAVTYGAPHRGSKFKGWQQRAGGAGCNKVQCGQMAKNSDFSGTLRNDTNTHNPQGRGGTDWTIIGSERDRIVPASSGTGMRAAHKVTYKKKNGYGHSDYAHRKGPEGVKVKFVDNYASDWRQSDRFPKPVPTIGYAAMSRYW